MNDDYDLELDNNPSEKEIFDKKLSDDLDDTMTCFTMEEDTND